MSTLVENRLSLAGLMTLFEICMKKQLREADIKIPYKIPWMIEDFYSKSLRDIYEYYSRRDHERAANVSVKRKPLYSLRLLNGLKDVPRVTIDGSLSSQKELLNT